MAEGGWIIDKEELPPPPPPPTCNVHPRADDDFKEVLLGNCRGRWKAPARLHKVPLFSSQMYTQLLFFSAEPEIFSDFFFCCLAVYLLLKWLIILTNESRDSVVENPNDRNHHRTPLDARQRASQWCCCFCWWFRFCSGLKNKCNRWTTNPFLSSFPYPGLPVCRLPVDRWKQVKKRNSSEQNKPTDKKVFD